MTVCLDPTPLIHARIGHIGLLKDCQECKAIKAKHIEVKKWVW